MDSSAQSQPGCAASPATSGSEGSAVDLLQEARTELFALCEATIDETHDIAQRDTEGKMGAYARGRKVEAKGISRAMGEVFRDLIQRAEWATQAEAKQGRIVGGECSGTTHFPPLDGPERLPK